MAHRIKSQPPEQFCWLRKVTAGKEECDTHPSAHMSLVALFPFEINNLYRFTFIWVALFPSAHSSKYARRTHFWVGSPRTKRNEANESKQASKRGVAIAAVENVTCFRKLPRSKVIPLRFMRCGSRWKIYFPNNWITRRLSCLFLPSFHSCTYTHVWGISATMPIPS